MPPIVKTVATEGEGVEPLINEIDKLVGSKSQEFINSRKKRLISWMLRDIISEKIYEAVSQNIPESEFESLVERIFKREIDPYTVADEIVGRLKKAKA
jgi:LAO/AO transport system kinase